MANCFCRRCELQWPWPLSQIPSRTLDIIPTCLWARASDVFRDVGDSLTYMGRSDVAIISSQTLKNHCSLNVLDNSGITYNMKLLYRSYACKRTIAVTFTHLPDPASSKGSHTCSSAGYILAKLGLKVWGSIFLGLTILFPKGGVGKVFFFFLFLCSLKVMTVKKKMFEKYPNSTIGSNGWLSTVQYIQCCLYNYCTIKMLALLLLQSDLKICTNLLLH